MYSAGKPVLTEMKVATLTIGQHHDNTSGLIAMMHRKRAAVNKSSAIVTSLAEDINELHRSGTIMLQDDRTVKCNIRCCLDLAAARGMRSCRGKAA
eukprot:92842-Pleurochrysis_carterae.AAC.1